MKYLAHSKLKEWRQANLPKECPIFKCKVDDAVVDHCHSTGLVRGVLHRQSNAWAGKIENSWKRFGQNNSDLTLPEALRALATYLEEARTDVLHPVGLRQKCNRFGRLPKDEQVETLIKFKCDPDEINSCKNSKARTQCFRTALIKQCT
jgi:hypothetical protein